MEKENDMETLVARWKPWDGGGMVAHASCIMGNWWVTNCRTNKARKVRSREVAYAMLIKLNRPRNHGGKTNSITKRKY